MIHGPGARPARWLATSTLVIWSGAVVLFALHYPERLSGRSLPVVAALGLFALNLYLAALGALLVARQPDNKAGWMLSATGVVIGLMLFLEHYVLHSLVTHPGSLPAGEVAAALTALGPALSWAPIIGFILTFPTGRLPSRRWRPVVWLAWTVLALLAAGILEDAPLITDVEVPGGSPRNPLAIQALSPLLSWLGDLAWMLMMVLILLSAASMVSRFVHARGVERQQLKWLALSMSVVVAGVLSSLVLSRPEDVHPTLDLIPMFLLGGGLVSLPLTAGLAILRYRLYDIDRIISRTVAYMLVVGALAAFYAVGVVTMSGILRRVTGTSDLAIAASTLAVAAAFGPVRKRVLRAVDHRFNRRRYDAVRTIESFSSRLRDEVDIETVRHELHSVLVETMAPAHVRLWLRPSLGDPPGR